MSGALLATASKSPVTVVGQATLLDAGEFQCVSAGAPPYVVNTLLRMNGQ